MTKVSVSVSDASCLARAKALAASLNVPLHDEDAEITVWVTPERLELREVGQSTGAIYADFLSGKLSHRLKTSGKKQALARAVGIKANYYPSVLDASAGLGQDAFVLASLGCEVTMLERSPIVAELLKDGLERAKTSEEVAPMLERLCLHIADASVFLSELLNSKQPDVIYFDPMYPESGKSALKKKEMRLFRMLVGDDTDAEEVLALALTCAKKRVVIKRSQKANTLGQRKPSAVVKGKTTRFDVYLV